MLRNIKLCKEYKCLTKRIHFVLKQDSKHSSLCAQQLQYRGMYLRLYCYDYCVTPATLSLAENSFLSYTVNKEKLQITRITRTGITAVTIDTAQHYHKTRMPIGEIFYSIYNFLEIIIDSFLFLDSCSEWINAITKTVSKILVLYFIF